MDCLGDPSNMFDGVTEAGLILPLGHMWLTATLVHCLSDAGE